MPQTVSTNSTTGLPTLNATTGAPSTNNADDTAIFPIAPRFAGDTNYWVPVFDPLVRDAVGVDIVPELLAEGRKRAPANVSFVEGDAIALQGDQRDRVKRWLEGRGVRRVTTG